MHSRKPFITIMVGLGALVLGAPATINQLDPATGAVRHSITFAFPQIQPSMTAHRGALWVAFDTAFDDQSGIGSGGTSQELNPRTGAVERQLAIGGDASAIRSAEGDLWVLDDTNGVITRLHLTQAP